MWISLLVPFLGPVLASAAACTPSPVELDRFVAGVKSSVVFEAESGMLLSTLDEDEMKKAAKQKKPWAACLKEALALEGDRGWRKDPAWREAMTELYCEKPTEVNFVFNVHPQRGAASFLRLRTGVEKGLREISLGGHYREGFAGCRAEFLAQAKGWVGEVVGRAQKLPEDPKASPEEIIRRGLERGIDGPSYEAPCPEQVQP